MNTVAETVEFIGAEKMAQSLGLSIYSIEKAKTQRRFPASWYDALERLAGRPLDRKLFHFRSLQ